MNPKTLSKAVGLARQVKHVFVATAGADGWPHISAAGRMGLTSEKHVAVADWFCPGTMANVQSNPRVAIVIWDAGADTGYQLLGEVEEIKDLGILDGYASEAEGQAPLPQVERQLLVHVDKILKFRRAPHSDVEE